MLLKSSASINHPSPISLQCSGLLLVVILLAMTQWVAAENSRCKQMKPSADRPHSVSITDFGAVGDGVTLNTKAFQNALFYLHSFADKGGAQLFVPSGRWLTGSFSLISHLTLSLDKDAVIIGSTVRPGLYMFCFACLKSKFCNFIATCSLYSILVESRTLEF